MSTDTIRDILTDDEYRELCSRLDTTITRILDEIRAEVCECTSTAPRRCRRCLALWRYENGSTRS